MHYYFYFIDEELGLCYLRVPTWCPFRLQFYCNGHNWLASQLQQEGIEFELCDNAFLKIADFDRANLLAANLDIQRLHTKLDHLAQCYCPVTTLLGLEYSWSIMQAEVSVQVREAVFGKAPRHYMLWWSKDTCRRPIDRPTICGGYVQAVPYRLGSAP